MPTRCLHRPAGGFTLVELLVVVAVLGLLAGIAWGGLHHALRQARRSDGIAALLQVQLAQERHRSHHPRYGSLAELRLPDASPGGHYRVEMASADADGFEARAVALGGQAGDAACRHLVLRVAAAHAAHASGADAAADNTGAVNRRCWSLG